VKVYDDKIDMSWWAEGYGTPITKSPPSFSTIIAPDNEKKDGTIIDTENMDLLKNYDFENYKPCKYEGKIKIRCYYDFNNQRICNSEWKWYSVKGEGIEYCKVKISPGRTYCVQGTNCNKWYYYFKGDAYIKLNLDSIKEIPIKDIDPNMGVKLGSFTLTWSVPKKVDEVEFVVIISEMYSDKRIANAICNIGDIIKITNENGEAKFNLKPGNYELRCTIPNHESIYQNITITSAGGWIGISTPKIENEEGSEFLNSYFLLLVSVLIFSSTVYWFYKL